MIHINNLTKDFKKTIKDPGLIGSVKSLFNPKTEIVRAVDNISFEVEDGEMLGFIGPNGAGKSTTIKMMTGILTPTSGTCEINGFIPSKDRKKYVKRIGVVFGQRTQLWWDLPLRETYSVLKEIYEVPEDRFKKRMTYLNEILDLESFITSPVRTLSLGQRMRADIAASLLHSPNVLFLDEPTIGLDVVVKDNIVRAIKEINEREKITVILTTHDISDIEKLCQRIVMIDKGKRVFDGDLSDLKNNFADIRELSLKINDISEIRKLNFIEKFNFSEDDFQMKVENDTINIRFNYHIASVKDMLEYILSLVQIDDISVKEADTEEIIKKLYRQGVKNE